MERHRSKATILSIISMGLGQIYNRQFIKGVMFLLIEAWGIFYFSGNLGRALWGIVTLGDAPRMLVKGKWIDGDHSIFIMVQSLITLLFFALFVIVYVMNIRDAYKTACRREEGKTPNTFRQSVRYVLDYKFAQSFLTLLRSLGYCFSRLCRSCS